MRELEYEMDDLEWSVDSPVHRLEVKEIWEQPDSAIRQLVRMSGRHPQSLRLLARQMSRRETRTRPEIFLRSPGDLRATVHPMAESLRAKPDDCPAQLHRHYRGRRRRPMVATLETTPGECHD